jgi:hypothetical protein
MFPDVAFDTYVAGSGPGGQVVVVQGFPAPSPVSFGGPSDPLPGTISASWGDLFTGAPGTFEIARLTFPRNILPGDVAVQNDLPGGADNPNNSTTSQVGPDVTVLIPDVPEPSALGLFAAGALLGARRCPRERPHRP